MNPGRIPEDDDTLKTSTVLRLWLSGLMLLVAAGSAAAQSRLKFEHLTTELGLSQNTVTSVLQDRKGFLWFGTREGLNRFDGYKFVIHRHSPGNPQTIADNVVVALLEDREGKIWVGTEQTGLSVFDPVTGIFTHFAHNPADPDSLSNNMVICLCQDRQGTIWIGTRNGLNTYERSTGKFIHYRHDPADPKSLSHDTINAIIEDRSGTLWFGTGGGLNRFDRPKGSFASYTNSPNDPRSLSHDVVQSLSEDQAGRLWVGTAKGLNILDPGRETFAVVDIPKQSDPRSRSDDNIRAIAEDRAKRLWVGTEKAGLMILDPERKMWSFYPNEPLNPGGFQGVEVRTIFEDRGGAIWIGTYIRGVNKYVPGKQKFEHILPPLKDAGDLNNNLIRSIYKDAAGILWVGTQGGLNRIDRRNNRTTFYTHDPRTPAGLSHPYVWAIYEDRNGVFWIGTRGGGMNRFDPRTGRCVHYRHRPDDPTSLSQDEVRIVYEDRSGALWVGTLGGLNLFDRSTSKFTRFLHDPAKSDSLTADHITAILETRAGLLWVGTNDGLNAYDRAKHTFRRYESNLADPQSLSYNRISALWEDGSGKLWIATYGGGIDRFDPETGMFASFGETEGLANNTVYAILGDAQDHLWLSTNSGISMFDPASRTFRNYDESDGVQGREFNSGAYCLSPDGEMFFGGMNGLNAFTPGNIEKNQHVPPIVITDFKINNIPVPVGETPDRHRILDKPISETQEIRLSYKDHLLSFDFAALDYQASEKNQYAYMLEGANPEWQNIGTRRSVDFDLKPGSYVFRVKGSNNDGVWNEEGASLRIVLPPPFWQTWWFRILLGLAGLAFVGQLLAWPHKKKALRAMQEARDAAEAANRTKSFFLANMSHELRTPLNAIIGYSEMLQEDAGDMSPEEYVGDLKKIQGAGKHLLSLINDILDLSKVEAGKIELHVERFDIKPLIQEMEATLRPLVEKNANTLQLDCPETIGTMNGDFTRVRQVLFNLLSNACKFTERGVISLGVSRELSSGLDCIRYVVRDTGIGITPDQMKRLFQAFAQADTSTTKKYGGTGLGLAISKRLCELMGGSIAAESEPGRGSVFTVILPAERPPRPVNPK